MTADSSTTTITHSGEGGGGGGIHSPSRRRSLPSPWAQVVRRGCEPDAVTPRSPSSSPLVSKQNDQLTVFEPEPAVVTPETQTEGSDGSNCGNAGGAKKSAWNKPSANGDVEGTTNTTPVMGAASWPALSESTRPVPKLLSPSESSSKSTSDGLALISQAPVVPQTQQKPAKTNANSHSNTTNTHPVRQLSMKRGGSTGGASAEAGYSRPLPPPPPPLPPPFPFFNMTYGNLVPAVLDSPVRDQPPFKGNNWVPRPMGGVGHDHSSNRAPSRRNNFGPRPHGDGGLYNNGYGGKHEHHDRDWRGPRSPASRDVHMPQQIVPPPPPPPPPREFFRQPHPGPASYIAGQPLRLYGTPMGYDMAAPFLYVPTLPPEPYRGAPLLPHAAPPPMFIPVMDPPLPVLILKQIEYYFSDANLVKDNFLRSSMDEEGWVPISLIACFRRVQNLTTDVQMILTSLRDSSCVEIQGEKVRRRNDWRKWVQTSETFIQKLTLEENSVSDAIEDDSSNGEVSTIEA